jgi:hypothetical protein
MISNMMTQLGNHTNIKIEEDLLRHMILNSLRSYNVKFKATYGEMIIACDGRRYWRKDIFPYYKAHRKVDREKSEIDWSSVFETMDKVKDELREFFPYRVIQLNEAEADDIIGTLCHKFSNTGERILIVSGDKDFLQMQSYMNVTQYDPVRKKMLSTNNAELFLKEHIIRGDRGDGVPNILSRDDCIITKTKQKQIRQAKLDVWLKQEPEEFCNEEMLRGWYRNQQLIDLNFIPINIQEAILASYEEQKDKSRSKMFNYFIAKKLKHLITDIQDF